MAPIERKAQAEERDVKRSEADASSTDPPKKEKFERKEKPDGRNPVKASILQAGNPVAVLVS